MCKLCKSERNAPQLSGDEKTQLAEVIDRADGITDTFLAGDVKVVASARNALEFYGGCEEIMAKGRGVKVKEGGN